MKRYSDITVRFYSEKYTDEDLTQLTLQNEKLYDEKPIANNTPEQYKENLRWDIQTMKDKNLKKCSCFARVIRDIGKFMSGGQVEGQ